MKKALWSVLLAAGVLSAGAEDAYIESDGTQYIPTGYCANGKRKKFGNHLVSDLVKCYNIQVF